MTHAGPFAPPPESVASPEASTAPQAASPPVVEGYLVSRCVARFAGGELYLADARQGTSRQVMIEWQPDGLARYSRRERLLKEAAGRVAHRNVAAFVEYGRTPQGSYLVIEPAGGALFTSSWNCCPLPPRQAAAMIESVARGIHQAHLRGLAHGSLGLGKVMIDADGAPVVFGFGLWSSFSQRQGSPWEVCYLAPEQIAQPDAEPTLATDVYAAGAMLYALLTGRSPFLGSSAQETARQVTSHKLVAPRALARGIPRDLEAICAACLSKSSAGRYESAEELANDLARYLASEPVHARRGPLRRLRGWWRGRPVAATASVAAVVAALGGLAAGLHQRHVLQSTREELSGLTRLVEERQVRDEANLREAVMAIDRLLQIAGREELFRLPQFDPFRARMLETAKSFHEALGRRNSFDEEMKFFVALSKFHVADLNRQLGFPDTAAMQFIQTLAIVRELKRDSVPTMELVARCNLSDGLMRAASGEYDLAEISFKTAIDAWQRLRDAMAGEARFVFDQARALRYRALLRIEARKHADAAADLRLALQLLDPLPEGEIPQVDIDLLKARCFSDLATAHRQLQQLQQAEEALGQARRLLDALQQSRKREFDLRYEQAALWADLAALKQAQADRPAAFQASRHAVALFEVVHAENPTATLVTRQLAQALAELANNAADAMGEFDRAAIWKRVRELREMLAAPETASAGDRLDLAAACRSEAAHAASERPEQAAALLERALAISGTLVQDQKALPWSALEQADACRALAAFRLKQQDPEAAAALLEQAVAARRKALAADAESTSASQALAEDLEAWAALLRQLGQDEAADRAAQEADKVRQHGARR